MLTKYKIANTLRIISEPKSGITIIPNPTGSGKSYETAIFIAWMLINSGRKIIFVTTRIANLNLVESDIAYHLKEMGEQDKIDKVVQIKSFVNCIKQSFLRLSDDIERIANRNKDLKEVFTVLRSELIRLEVETKNSKNNQDSNKAVIKSINEHISNLEPKFRNLLSEEFAKSYNHNSFDQKGNCISSYDYMMNSEEWKFIAELYPSSQHSQKQVFIMTSAKFLEKDDPIISKRYMLTSYLSVSRGNNLQINIGKDEVRNRLDSGELLPVNNWPISGHVDWDSIYMEKPSHVVPDLKNELSLFDENNDIITSRLRLFLTVEELFARGDINKQKKNAILKEVFDYLESGYAEKLNARLKDYNDIYRLFSVKTDYTTIIYQTMGRIVRTSVKKPCNAIFYDVDMLEHIKIRTLL